MQAKKPYHSQVLLTPPFVLPCLPDEVTHADVLVLDVQILHLCLRPLGNVTLRTGSLGTDLGCSVLALSKTQSMLYRSIAAGILLPVPSSFNHRDVRAIREDHHLLSRTEQDYYHNAVSKIELLKPTIE